MDLNRVSMGEKIAGAAALLLLILSFVPLWAKYEVKADFGNLGDFSTSQRFSAWSEAFGFLMKLGLIIALIVVAYVIAKAAAADVSFVQPLFLLIASGIVFLIVLFYVLVGPREFGLAGAGLEISRGPLLFLGGLLGLGMAAGAFLHFQAAGGTTAIGGRPAAAPPPPGPPA